MITPVNFATLGKTVPLLVTETTNLCDSTEILKYLNNIASEDKKLYPNDVKLRSEVEKLEELFDTQLGVATRYLGFYFTLQKPWKIPLIWAKNATWTEKIGCIILSPITIKLVRDAYQVNKSQKNLALQTIKNIFCQVDEKLGPDRKYLVGNNISAADISY